MWAFLEPQRCGVNTNPTEGELFVNDRVDRNDTLIREAGQNTNDARHLNVTTAELRITLCRGSDAPAKDAIRPYIENLLPHLKATGVEMESIDFNTPSILLVEDFGTIGLQGAVDDDDGDNLALFWRNVGDSHKGGTRGGRWGLGKTVFANSSRLSAWFGLTIRANDMRELLIGQVSLRKHKIGEKTYQPHALFCSAVPVPGEYERPIEDDERLGLFRSTFGLTRKKEPGLSIVIPFPHESITVKALLVAAIQHFFFPILRGSLIIKINGRELSSHTLRNIAAELDLQNMEEAIKVAEAICTLPLEQPRSVDNPEALNFPDGSLSGGAFTPDSLSELKQAYRQGQLIGIRVPIVIRPKHAAADPSHIKLFIKNIPEMTRGQDFYLRDGISVIEHRTFGEAEKAIGILLADDRPVSQFLGDAENPAHTAWNAKGRGLEIRYNYPQKTVMFIRRSLRQFFDIVAKEEDVEDREALADVFFVPQEGPGEKPTPPTLPPPPSLSKIQKVELSKINGGFIVKAGKGLVQSDLPLKVSIEAAYEIRRGNPFRNYDRSDFELESDSFIVAADMTKVSSVSGSGNILAFQADALDFKVEVTGFDPHRDLKLNDKFLVEKEDDTEI